MRGVDPYGGFDSDPELEELYASITGRPAFSYAPGRDPLFRSYADRYVQGGRLAMRDTVGQSAALTGGYGSSYAHSAGQQRYDEYLRQLGEVLPELYGQAFERYQAEGAAQRETYALARQRRADEYQRGRDALADERYEAEQRSKADERAYRQQQDSYAQLYKLISSTGYRPTDEELEGAGLSRAQAEALRYEYLRKVTPAARGGGGGGGGRKKKKTESAKSTLAPTLSDGRAAMGLAAGGALGLSGYGTNKTR